MDYDQWNPLISLSQIFTSLGYRTWKTPGSVSRKNTQRYESFQITFDTHFSSNRPTFPEENFVLTNEKDIVLINFISVRSFDTFTDTGTAVNVGTVAAITHQDVNKYAIKKKKLTERKSKVFCLCLCSIGCSSKRPHFTKSFCGSTVSAAPLFISPWSWFGQNAIYLNLSEFNQTATAKVCEKITQHLRFKKNLWHSPTVTPTFFRISCTMVVKVLLPKSPTIQQFDFCFKVN